MGVRGLRSRPFKRRRNVFDYAIEILQYVVVPIAKNEIAHRFENLRPFRVGRYLHSMLSAADFNDQMSISAAEIDNKTADGKLSAEFPTGQTAIARPEPQCAFCVGQIAAKSPRRFGACLHAPSPLTPTLSPTGRGSTSGRNPSRWQMA